jgi:hypothetical protein
MALSRGIHGLRGDGSGAGERSSCGWNGKCRSDCRSPFDQLEKLVHLASCSVKGRVGVFDRPGDDFNVFGFLLSSSFLLATRGEL